MDKTIGSGDLVYIYRIEHACSIEHLGFVFVVQQIHPLNPVCTVCLAQICPGSMSAMTPNGHGVPLPWLKRIPPLGELEGADSWEEINTPVML